MRRREFIAGIGNAAAWPLVAPAQQGDRVRRMGVLLPTDENNPQSKSVLSAFTQALADLGWTDGRNVRMDLRWAGGDSTRIRALAHELVGLKPDIIVTTASATLAVQRETRTIPIVFATVSDPVASGLVARLDRPGGNSTGFGGSEPSLGGKWLELLSEIAPGLKRAAIVPITAPVHSDAEIETAIIGVGRESRGSLVVMPDAFTAAHRASIISAAARNNVPAVYANSALARDGGLLSYGPDAVDIFRRAATYVDRILRGAKPGDLPVQFPVKYEMVVNLKTAKALGLTVPQSILLRADEVIE
jgi:putative ABC transport system substrate-binding protein